jgi:diguanylate cyclase (GGDEF)-like protein
MATTPMFDPNGQVRLVPQDKKDTALKAGGKLAYKMRDPKGTMRWVPQDRLDIAKANGGTIVEEMVKQATQQQPVPGQIAAPQYLVGTSPKGLVEQGNIDISNRPVIKNDDGSHSSEYSVSFSEDGREVLVPTVVNGRFLTPNGKKPKERSPEEQEMFKEAWKTYKATKQHLGKFSNIADADAYAYNLHNRADRATVQAYKPTLWESTKAAIAGIPVAPGKTAGDVGRDISNVWMRFNNPELMTDEQWAQRQQDIDKFFDQTNLSSFEKGVYSQAVKTGEELALTPAQLALMFATFGGSGLARVAYKMGMPGLAPTARVLSKLMQAQFMSQMAEGAYRGAGDFAENAVKGDWEAAGRGAVEALVSGLMTVGGVSHEQAQERVQRDLERVARERHGDVPGGFTRVFQSRFDKLNPFEQGQVIEQAVKETPEYQAVVSGAQGVEDQARKDSRSQQQRRLHDYYSTAVDQSWDPSVAARTIRNLEKGRARGKQMEARRDRERIAEQENQMYADRAAQHEAEARRAQEESREEGREERGMSRQKAAAERARRTEQAKDLESKRSAVFSGREAMQQPKPEGALPERSVDVRSIDGGIQYAGDYWDQEYLFGVSPTENGADLAVYRQTPDGVTWLNREGNWEEAPESMYTTTDPNTADTIARLHSVSAEPDTLAVQRDATPEQVAEADKLSQIRRDITDGVISAKDARAMAGIADKVSTGDDYKAARDGNLNGPYNESSHGEYYANLAEEARKAGMTQEETNALLDESRELARRQTEDNLHHVYKPGDYIFSKRGVRWTLDSKGMLHPDSGGAPVPLMKGGLYSNQALQLTASGRVGYGTQSREQRRIADAHAREVRRSIQNRQEEVDREMILARQNVGLETTPENLPRADEAEKAERRAGIMTSIPSRAAQLIRTISREVYNAPTSPDSAIRSIARTKGVSPEEVMRQALASDLTKRGTPEGKIAGLEVGDKISDQFKPNNPWVVEQKANGDIQIRREGTTTTLPLDRLNPSDRVIQIAKRGEVTTNRPVFSAEDAAKAAFESPHVIWQKEMAQEIDEKTRVKDPEPRTPDEAKTQAKAAERRATAAQDVATRTLVKALNPTTGTVEEAERAVDLAREDVKTAEEGYAQQVTAEAKAVPDGEYPQRAEISIGLKGRSSVIIQNNREVPFHYELVPVGLVRPSHVWRGNKLIPNPEFPETLQPRTISESQAKQIALWAQPGTYNFRLLADKTLAAATGWPIVDQGGDIAGGNTRFNIFLKYLENIEAIGDPEVREATRLSLRAKMIEEAREVGIRRFPDDDEDYIVVRMMDKPITSSREAADLGRLFNKSVSVQITQDAKGVSYSKAFTPAMLEDIGRRVEVHDGISGAINADPEFFRDVVVNQFGIVPEEEADWFEEKPGRGKVLSDRGQQQFAKAMLGSVIDNPNVLRLLGGKTPYRALERALGYVVKMRALPDFDISGQINEAMNAASLTIDTDPGLSRLNNRWSATFRPDQTELEGMSSAVPPEPTRIVEAIWRALHASDAATPRVFSDRLKAFLGDEDTRVVGSMFDEVKETPAEAFNRAFKKELKEVAFARGDKVETITQAEFDAALKNRELGDQERQDAEVREFATKGGRGESPEQGERRKDFARRKAIAEMSPEELRRELGEARAREFTSAKTGLPNRHAFDEKQSTHPAPAVAFIDVDGLKAFNDKFGHEAGDRLLSAAADAFREAGVDAFHFQGDEFGVRGEDQQEIAESLKKASEILKAKQIETKEGKTQSGIDFSYGVSGDLKDAESKMYDHKEERKAKGEGVRGVLPPKPPSPEEILASAKKERGYVTPAELRRFLDGYEATKKRAGELFRTVRLMAEYVFDTDPPVGVDRKQALDWVLRERLASIGAGTLKEKRGQLTELETGKAAILLHQASDATTFIHEFAHLIFPLLSDADLRAIESIKYRGKEKVERWDGTRKGLTKEIYESLSEKLAYGLEKYLRDQNPKDFEKNANVGQLLAKVKEIFGKIYRQFRSDPLTVYKLGTDSLELFDKMFHVTGRDEPDAFWKDVLRERAAEKKMKKPEEADHPLVKEAKGMWATRMQDEYWGTVVDSGEKRVDPNKPLLTYTFKDEAAALKAYADLMEKYPNVAIELVRAPGDRVEVYRWGVRTNTATKPPKSILFQDLTPKLPGVRLQELEEQRNKLPSYMAVKARLLDLQIENLKNEIRASRGIEELRPQPVPPEMPKQVIEEAKRGKRTDDVRERPHGIPAPPQHPAARGIPKPPVMGVPHNAAAAAERGGGGRGAVGGGARGYRSLEEVEPVALQPLPAERGDPVGTVVGEAFDQAAWVAALREAGLPETIPPPTVTLQPKVATQLKYPGQKQIAQMALSALLRGDGFIVASSTGTGKSFTGSAIIKEFRDKNPNARILYITKNRKLLNKTKGVMVNSFGYEMDIKSPRDQNVIGTYGVSYQRTIKNGIYKQMHWDLVIADECGEARNWYQEDSQQGKLFKEITDNANKVVYMSATPFHSPMEYGYLDKMHMYPRGGFDSWIEQNFAHEKVGDKVFARLDPSKQAKLRQQLIERGQMVSQAISYEGFTAHLGVVPVTESMKRNLNRISEGFVRAKKRLELMEKKGAAEKAAAFEAVYTKSYLERELLPNNIELARRALAQGYQVILVSEHSAEDLFRRPREEGVDPSTYQMLDDEMNGKLSEILPPFPDAYDTLKAEFGDQIGDYSGRGNTLAERETAINDFLTGKKRMIYTTYAAGGIGVDMHDADYPALNVKGGDKPRVLITLGVPYSGVLLEQMMGRPWRFGVKSDVHVAILTTDSAPDIRLMQTKVAPRMQALRASVLGHDKDSLAKVMATYNSTENVRLRQDMLAFAEGAEERVNAARYQVRSKDRQVGINDWSAIQFPHADTAKNRGMKYGAEVAGGDWTTLFQRKYEMFNPDEPEVKAAKDEIEKIANQLTTGKAPANSAVQNLDPVDRDNVVAVAAASAARQAEIPVDRDRQAAARASMKADMHLPGDPDKWVVDNDGAMKYTGDPYDLTPEPDNLPPNIKTRYNLPNIMSQEYGIMDIARQAKVPKVGEELRRMERTFWRDQMRWYSQYSMAGTDILSKYKLNIRKTDEIKELWDVMNRKTVSKNPNINAAAGELVDLRKVISDQLLNAGVDQGRITWLENPKEFKGWETVLGYFDQAAESLSKEENFGKNMRKVYNEIDKIPSRNGRSTISAMFDAMVAPQDWDTLSGKFYNAMIGYEAASKMMLSFVKVPYHLSHAFQVMSKVPKGMTSISLGGLETAMHPRRVLEEATFSGTLAKQLNFGDVGGHPEEKSLAHAVFKKYMFQAFYRWGRAIAATGARTWMEQYALHELKKGGTSAEHTRRTIRDVMLIGDRSIDEALRSGRWSSEDLQKSQVAFANLTMFSDNPMQMPGWARLDVRRDTPSQLVTLARAVRLTYALQSFTIKTTSLIREHLWDEVMIHHNYRTIAPFLVLYPVVGEMLRASTAGTKAVGQLFTSGATKVITGKGQKKEDAWEKWLADWKDDLHHGAVGYFKRYLDDLTYTIAWDRTRRLSDPLLNLLEGKRGKEMGPGFKYLFEDEIEQDIGAAYNDLVVQTLIKLPTTILSIESGKMATPEQKLEREEKSLLKFFLDQFPIYREDQDLKDFVTNQKHKGFTL